LQIREKLTRLTLDNKTIVALEKARAARGEELYTPFWVKLPFLFLCLVLDVLYEGKPIQVGCMRGNICI
jgi:ubiquinol oxidase